MDISKKEYFHNTSTLKPKSLMIVSSTKTPKIEPPQARYRGTIFIVKFHQSKTYKKQTLILLSCSSMTHSKS